MIVYQTFTIIEAVHFQAPNRLRYVTKKSNEMKIRRLIKLHFHELHKICSTFGDAVKNKDDVR